jgi:hypothetical protein
VLLDPKWPEKWPFRPEDFLRYDESGGSPFRNQGLRVMWGRGPQQQQQGARPVSKSTTAAIAATAHHEAQSRRAALVCDTLRVCLCLCACLCVLTDTCVFLLAALQTTLCFTTTPGLCITLTTALSRH